MKRNAHLRAFGFSLVEVVLALGVVGFAIVAILGMIPIGLNTGHDAQNDTRAAQIAQAILSTVASQTQTQFSNIQLPLNDTSVTSFDLTSSQTKTIYADNDGQLIGGSTNAAYAIVVATNSSPTGFDPGYANQMTLSIVWPAAAASTSQTKRSFIRIFTKY